MKSEIRTLLDQVLQTEEKQAVFVNGDYSMVLEAGAVDLLINNHPVAKYSFGDHRLSTLDWNCIKENRYLAYRLEQLGYIVHADSFL